MNSPYDMLERTHEQTTACADSENYPEMWFPDRANHPMVETAKQLCGSCHMFRACEDAAQTHKAYGIWAGKLFRHGKIIG